MAVLQLIYASSELSYYVQLALVVADIAGIVIVAARASLLTIIGVVVTSVTVATLMPVETVFGVFFDLTNSGPLQPGDAIVKPGELSEFALAMARFRPLRTYGTRSGLSGRGLNQNPSENGHSPEAVLVIRLAKEP